MSDARTGGPTHHRKEPSCVVCPSGVSRPPHCAPLWSSGSPAPPPRPPTEPPSRERARAASRAPVPGADALSSRSRTLGDLGSVLTPVTELLDTVLKADNGQLTPEQATRLGDAVKTAVAGMAAAPAVTLPQTRTPALPQTPALPALPELPALPAVPAVPPLPLPAVKSGQADDKADARRAASADVQDDAIAAVQKAVGELLAAATSGDVGKVVPSATGVINSLVDLVAATLLGAGLPAADMTGLPELASLPADAASLPAAETPSLPAEVPALPAGILLPAS
ncbi:MULTISPECIES: hypothetical protein [unclassified Streptomyces]|uniref:hypothetical protein n=1 Tax=unclassified Streptomyces TaxID=2593676 RepID=UPI003D7514D5